MAEGHLDGSPPRPGWRRRLALYWTLVRGDRPIGWLLLWPTWWGLWIAADGEPPLWIPGFAAVQGTVPPVAWVL